ncbi:hypothetical protein TNCT_432521, partial [Trichonephila clavata]
SIVSAETMPLLDMGHQTLTNTGFYKVGVSCVA